MYGSDEHIPTPEKSPHENFSHELYDELENELPNILPGKVINTGYLCKGDRSTARFSFTGAYGEPLHPDDWTTLKEFASTFYSEKITSKTTAEVTNENTTITFTEGDPEYDDTQTITITHITQDQN